MTKFIVVSGGVISGVGKGITSASIGKILKMHGYGVTLIKIDPYINCDAGTLRPTEHGEVWVTHDGGEIDQDLGNYERFLGSNLSKKNSITTGQIYSSVIKKERSGEYLGETVQFIPHITDEIVDRVLSVSKDFEVVVIEIGGTVGDYENVPYLLALKSLRDKSLEKNMSHVLVTYLPIPSHIGEMKTKPTQQAIRLLNKEGISPDFIICRSKHPLDKVRRNKIELFSNIRSENLISAVDVKSIYEVPINFESENLGIKILKSLGLKSKKIPNWDSWNILVDRIVSSYDDSKTIDIGIVGKYLNTGDYELTDSYLSIEQALVHAGAEAKIKVKISWLNAANFETESDHKELKKLDGILVPGGFGDSGIEGKINVIKYARENNVPYLGICYGMQLAVIEFARNVCKIQDANTSEVDSKTKNPVVTILPVQKEKILDKGYGGTMRLGDYLAEIDYNSNVYNLYNASKKITLNSNKFFVTERHRHRYEVNPKYINKIAGCGLSFSGFHVRNDGVKLAEFIELQSNNFFIATQAHPEFNSKLGAASPLFKGFVDSAKKYLEAKQDKFFKIKSKENSQLIKI